MEQFFSTRVTHIIVKGGTTPQKPIKSVSQSRRAADAAKNPFLDGSKSTDLISKAEELQMKVWTVKSKFYVSICARMLKRALQNCPISFRASHLSNH